MSKSLATLITLWFFFSAMNEADHRPEVAVLSLVIVLAWDMALWAALFAVFTRLLWMAFRSWWLLPGPGWKSRGGW